MCEHKTYVLTVPSFSKAFLVFVFMTWPTVTSFLETCDGKRVENLYSKSNCCVAIDVCRQESSELGKCLLQVAFPGAGHVVPYANRYRIIDHPYVRWTLHWVRGGKTKARGIHLAITIIISLRLVTVVKYCWSIRGFNITAQLNQQYDVISQRAFIPRTWASNLFIHEEGSAGLITLLPWFSSTLSKCHVDQKPTFLPS